ncbi:MAG: pyridoxamine 5'-phosphate oxidase family protein [Chloroflexi bacterium]|nr:pyridoxamine 5'-phosphate oxidase family protein [Chloroflexota bacterium]
MPIDPATPEKIAAIRAFVQAPPGGTWMITLQRNGGPYVRRVNPVVSDDFTVQHLTLATHLKVKHIARNPNVTYLFLGLPDPRQTKNVFIQGKAEVIRDPQAVEQFIASRPTRPGANPGPAGQQPERYLIRLRPTLVRAEGFAEQLTLTPLILKQFD